MAYCFIFAFYIVSYLSSLLGNEGIQVTLAKNFVDFLISSFFWQCICLLYVRHQSRPVIWPCVVDMANHDLSWFTCCF